MNKQQIEDINARISNIEKLDIDNLVSFIFKDQDINSIAIGQFLVPEYISTVKRLIRQFSNEFEENGHYLPIQYNYQNEFGNGNLQNDIQQLYNLIAAKNHSSLINSVGFLNRLVYYQIDNGFWEKSTRKIHKANEIKITELNDQLNYIGNQLKENSRRFNELLDGLNVQKNNLQKFIGQKNQELQQVANNLQSSNSNTNQIAQLLTNSTSTSEKINGLKNQQEQNVKNALEKVSQLDDLLKDRKLIFREIENTQNEKVTVLERQIKVFTEKLDFVESKTEFFEERNNYLEELIGREVGASLFETFKQRKGELEKPVGKWLIIVIAMAVLTFGAIIVIFTNAFGYLGQVPAEISTIRLITNSIKTLPFFFLLFYAISQYNKERNFQEEYAFKSSVALTIKAYSDIVKKEELKDELIVNSVSGVYKSPTIYRTKKSKEDNSILDTAKDLLGTALEVLKKK